jgi:deoxyribonuclease IV
MKFGCHVSIRNGYFGAAQEAKRLKANCYQYFPKNPRSLSVKEFNRNDALLCKDYCKEHGIISVSHTPYPTSLTPTKSTRDITVQSLLNDLEISDACGSIGVVVHFGKQVDLKNPLAGYQKMIEILNEVLSQWEGACKILIENNAGVKGTMGTTLEELVQVRNLTDYPEKIGFCLDTCHAFASGHWDGDNWEDLVRKGEKLEFFDHLEVIHLNNSKYPYGLGKDRHDNIFKGHIEESQFDSLITSGSLKDVPMILETPSDNGITKQQEIQQLIHRWG